jgi:bacterioferritin-associated ferredoxin
LFVCICARVRECEVRSVIRLGACSEDAVADVCGAGTGCGTCLDRIEQILDEEGMSDTRIVRVG